MNIVMSKEKRQVVAETYTAFLDNKIHDPDLKYLRMGYKKQKSDIQKIFLDGYDAAYESAVKDIEALQNRVKDLETECSGMGKLLESGVVIKTDEYLALCKVLEAASSISRDTTDCGRCMAIYDTLSELRMIK